MGHGHGHGDGDATSAATASGAAVIGGATGGDRREEVVRQLDRRFDGGAGDRLREAARPGLDGAFAALDSFYYALNERDLLVLRQVWSEHPLAQLNNPLGGILRGGDAIVAFYGRVLRGEARLTVALEDVVLYAATGHAVFAGRERGAFIAADGTVTPLEIRTTRYLRFDPGAGGWRQVHHHGSIDDADLLRRYQAAVAG